MFCFLAFQEKFCLWLTNLGKQKVFRGALSVNQGHGIIQIVGDIDGKERVVMGVF